MGLRWSTPLILVVLAAGCASNVPVPRGAAQRPEAAESAWERVLSKHVDERGRIDFAGLAKDPTDLHTFVAYVGVVSPPSDPASYPTQSAVLAYSLNAYNALAMYNVIESGIPPELGTIKFKFFYKNKLLMGGQRISLYDLENKLVRPMGDPRVHFALNCMVQGCPRLPREPFEASRLDEQLDAAAKLFFSEARNVELRPEKKVVRFSEILRFYTKDFLAKAPTLIAYANQYRVEKIATDWKVEFIPYDWKLNKQ
ncbi:MAG TPA: DUF547 domain-containing protein [Thermoanaerobaculia bacterium]|jgi:hypothetical protein